MAGCEIHTVFTSISGGHIKGFNSHGIVAVKNKEVAPRDLERVIDAAKAVAIPMDREVLHVLPQDYIIDDQDGIKEPLGMSGVRLEAKVHIVTGAVTSAQNIIKCCNRSGLERRGDCLGAAGRGRNGVDGRRARAGCRAGRHGRRHHRLRIVARRHGEAHRGARHRRQSRHQRYRHRTCAPRSTTPNDSSSVFGLRGCAHGDARTNRVEMPSVAGKGAGTVSRQILCEIIEPRLDEIFELVQRRSPNRDTRIRWLPGVVVTGGSMLLPGAIEMAEAVFRSCRCASVCRRMSAVCRCH